MPARRTKRVATVSIAAVLLSILTTSGVPSASATSSVTFDAVGGATGIEVTASNPTIPVGLVIEGSGPTAQARLSSLGTADSFAALPYPGDTAANLPGTVTALTAIPLPDYPLYVHAQNGTPPVSASYGGANLSASSTGTRSNGHATAGTDGVGYYADSTAAQDSDGSVSVTSVARQNGLDIGGLITLSGVVSTSQADLDSSGKITTKSSLVVGRFVAPGLKYTIPPQICIPTQACQKVPAPFGGLTITNPDIGLDKNGFYLTLPVGAPVRFPIPTDTVLSAFSQLGVTATYQQAVTTPTSVVAASLSLKTTLPSLPNNPAFNGPTPVTYVLARSSAAILGSVTDDGSGTVPIDTGSAGFPGGSDPIPSENGSVGVTNGELPPTVGGTVPPTVDVPPSSSGGGGQSPVLAASERAPLHSVFFFYLVLVGVGLVGSTAGQVLRYLGVRASWTS